MSFFGSDESAGLCWDGVARLAGGGRQVVVSADPSACWVQVYAPVGADFLCVEPMTHRPDALNAPSDEADSGLIILDPAQTLSLRMTIEGGD